MACSAVVYDHELREALLLFKFGRRDILAPTLARFMTEFARQWMSIDDVDWIVPVPLHPVRRRERGFNQAELLAKQFSNSLNGPPVVSALVKTVPTPDGW